MPRIRKINKAIISLLVVLAVTGFSCEKKRSKSNEKAEVSNKSKNKKPNFLIIIADDAGWNDMGFHGSEIKTPHLDQLADHGIELDRYYVSPTCSPTRASLLTGMPASRIGIVAPISGRSEKTLPDSVVTLPQALKKAAYRTALIGKWHLGLKTANGPEAFGFDYSYGFLHGQIDQYTHNYKNGDPSWHRNGKLIKEKGHSTDLITKEALQWLDQHEKEKQFYLQLAYSAPHVPLQEPEKWVEKYDFIKNKSRRHYAAAMTHLDDAIGKVLHHLDRLGLRENTLVLFMSDNGAQKNWYPTDQYNGRFEANDRLGSNKPLRDYKASNYEGAIRVPAIVSWEKFPKGHAVENYVSVIDIMPTFLQLAGVEIPNEVEGETISGILKEKNNQENHSIYIRGHVQENLIQKPWKLIRTRHLNAETEFELYNIEVDPFETKDLIKSYPKVVTALKQKIEDEFRKDDMRVNVPLK